MHSLNAYSASSLKQQATGRNVAPLGHFILILCPLLLNVAFLAQKQQISLL